MIFQSASLLPWTTKSEHIREATESSSAAILADQPGSAHIQADRFYTSELHEDVNIFFCG